MVNYAPFYLITDPDLCERCYVHDVTYLSGFWAVRTSFFILFFIFYRKVCIKFEYVFKTVFCEHNLPVEATYSQVTKLGRRGPMTCFTNFFWFHKGFFCNPNADCIFFGQSVVHKINAFVWIFNGLIWRSQFSAVGLLSFVFTIRINSIPFFISESGIQMKCTPVYRGKSPDNDEHLSFDESEYVLPDAVHDAKDTQYMAVSAQQMDMSGIEDDSKRNIPASWRCWLPCAKLPNWVRMSLTFPRHRFEIRSQPHGSEFEELASKTEYYSEIGLDLSTIPQGIVSHGSLDQEFTSNWKSGVVALSSPRNTYENIEEFEHSYLTLDDVPLQHPHERTACLTRMVQEEEAHEYSEYVNL